LKAISGQQNLVGKGSPFTAKEDILKGGKTSFVFPARSGLFINADIEGRHAEDVKILSAGVAPHEACVIATVISG
jgi:hypothetical protein